MEPQELIEMSEKSHPGLERRIGLTMAVFAAVLAAITLLGHRLHTDEVVLQTKLADEWAYYQAKNTRAQMYNTDAGLARLLGSAGAGVAGEWTAKANEERRQADEIRHANEELERETQLTARRATYLDSGEVLVEIAIVLCSIALLTEAIRFWYLSFPVLASGVVAGALSFLIR